MDKLRSVCDVRLTELQSSNSEIRLLSSKLDLEKEQRRSALNNSFAHQDDSGSVNTLSGVWKTSLQRNVESCPSNDTLHPEAPVPVVSFYGPSPALSHAPSPMRFEASSGNGTLGVQMAAT
ncbi:hypothetical protein J6590_101013 [Homalodisca vitripennis]|nr:hypothetical protein J6590_101013 [Homalodisca vitripennis]